MGGGSLKQGHARANLEVEDGLPLSPFSSMNTDLERPRPRRGLGYLSSPRHEYTFRCLSPHSGVAACVPSVDWHPFAPRLGHLHFLGSFEATLQVPETPSFFGITRLLRESLRDQGGSVNTWASRATDPTPTPQKSPRILFYFLNLFMIVRDIGRERET